MAEKSLKFTCPNCGGHKLLQAQSVMKGYEVKEINPNGYVITGDKEIDLEDLSGGCTYYFTCADCADNTCGFTLEDEEGNPISEYAKIVEWIKANCPQE